MLPAIVTASLLCFAVPGFADTWDYFTDVDKMTSKESRRAVVTSDNTLNLDFPYKSTNNYGRVTVRYDASEGTDVAVLIEKGHILCPSYGRGCNVTVRFDEATPIRFRAIGPSDHSTTIFFIHDTKRFIAGASKAKKILIQFTMYQAGNQTLEFSPPSPLVWGATKKTKTK